MAKEKKSFFERLTGARSTHSDQKTVELNIKEEVGKREKEVSDWMEETNEEGQLTVDVYQTADEIIVKTITAGVKPDDLDIAITRDMITIKGERQTIHEVNEGDYFNRELYWGSFSRTILLPEEVDVEGAEASEKHGLLTIKLPKLDKNRETKLKVRIS